MTVFLVLPRFLTLFSDMGEGHFSIFSRTVYTVGPLGWLRVMLVIGTLAVLKDLRFPSRYLNIVFTAILALLVIGIIFTITTDWHSAVSDS